MRPKATQRFCSRMCGVRSRPTLEERFWAKVRRGEGCWVWTGAVDRFGHGRIGHADYAHRMSWEFHRGTIPPGMCVCHHCDNPPCVNPDHLFLGTPKDNHADMVAKGRHRPGPPLRGEANPWAKLTAEGARHIRAARAAGAPLRELAAIYGVSISTVSKVALGRCWRHL